MNLCSKGETLGNVSHVPSSVSPLHPHSFTPSGRPLSGYKEFAYRQTIDMEKPLFKVVKIHTFLKFSRLKFDNSLSLKQSNFYTPTSFTKILGLKFLTLSFRVKNISSNVWRKPNEPSKFWNFETNSLFCQVKISNRKPR